jgi:hypothetical protein
MILPLSRHQKRLHGSFHSGKTSLYTARSASTRQRRFNTTIEGIVYILYENDIPYGNS